MRHRARVAVLSLAAVLAACGNGKSILQAGLPDAATTTTAPADTGNGTGTGPTTPIPTSAPPTTVATPLDDLPPCDTTALDDAAAGGPVPITFWHAMSNELGKKLDALTAAYNASQDKVKVNLQFQGGYETNIDKYLQADQNSRPDMVQMPEYMVQKMVDTHSNVPVGACIRDSSFDVGHILPKALGAYATGGVQWAMPFNASTPVLYYNRKIFTAAGLNPAGSPVSLDDLRAVSQTIVSSGAAPFALAVDSSPDAGGGWFIEQWSAKADVLYANNANGRAAPATNVLFAQPQGVELMTFLQAMVRDGLAVNVGDNPSGNDALLKLADKTSPATMTIATSAALGPVLGFVRAGAIAGVTDADLGVGPMPGPTANPGSLLGGASLWIVDGKGAAKAAAAWDYIQYLVDAATQSDWAATTGYVPVNLDAPGEEPLKSLYVADPRFRVAYDQLNSSVDSPASSGPIVGPLREVRVVVAQAVSDILAGADPATRLQQAAQTADQLIANYSATAG